MVFTFLILVFCTLVHFFGWGVALLVSLVPAGLMAWAELND